MNYIIDQILYSDIYIEPYQLKTSINDIILLKLKKKYENLCYVDGFIINNSIEIIKKTMGEVITFNHKNVIKYNIKYKAKVISPSNGEKIEVYVSNKNKMGIIAYVKIKEYDINNSEDSPLIIIIPLEYINESDSYDFNSIHIGQKMNIQVIGKRIKYNSNKIQIVAKPI